MRKPHLDFLALAVRLLEGFCVGQCAEAVTHILIEIAGDLAHGRRRTLGLQRADRTVVLAGPVVDVVALIDVAGAGQLRATRANVDIAFLVEDKIRSAEGAIGEQVS